MCLASIVAVDMDSHGIITNSIFENNSFEMISSCVDVDGGTMIVANTVFKGNGINFLLIQCSSLGTMSLSNVTVINNLGRPMSLNLCTVNISNSNFRNNYFNNLLGQVEITHTNLTISDSKFEKNSALLNGGCFYMDTGSMLNITRCKFLNNFSHTGSGGVFYLDGVDFVFISYCVFEGNHAKDEGGVFASRQIRDVAFKHCTFQNNYASVGGVASITLSNIEFSNSLMDYNNASKSGETLYIKSSHVKMNYVNFQNNKALQHGGGIYEESSVIGMYNSDGMGNIAGNKGGFIIIMEKSKLSAQNLKMAGNEAKNAGSGIDIGDHSDAKIEFFCVFNISNSTKCPIDVNGASRLEVTTLYYDNSCNIHNS